MTYEKSTALAAANEWDISAEEVAEWERRNYIPDALGLHKNMEKNDRELWYNRFVGLLGDGWLNAEAICRHYGWKQTRLSNILTYQRNPEEHAGRGLYGEEVDRLVADFLSRLQVLVSSAVRRAELTPTDQLHSPKLQADLIELINLPFLKPSRLRQGLPPSNANRLRDMLNGKRKPFHKLSDKPLLKWAFSELSQMEAILLLGEVQSTPKSAPN